MKDERNAVQDIMEKCVLCGKKTEYMHQMPIDERKDYVPGVGQLCSNCYAALYLKTGETK